MIITDPREIEKRSLEIIESALTVSIPEGSRAVVERVIHTTADFDYAVNLAFSEGAVSKALNALRSGCDIVTDTQMAKAGINKTALSKLGCTVHCFMSDPDVAAEAAERGCTRAKVSMEKAARVAGDGIFVIGNAPTALLMLKEMIDSGEITPRLVVGVPVGFVNVVESKEEIMQAGVPYIVARGRKGGSTVAAAIVNALMYQITR